MAEPRFLVVGASGWVGHYLVPELRARHPGAEILALFGRNRPVFPEGPGIRLVEFSGDLPALIGLLPPATLLHLGRGETDADFAVHQALIALQNSRGARYLYASSFNAVDAELTKAHFEHDAASAQSDYGRFKARCETELFRACLRPLAFRFAATHGWAPNREARTEAFLRKLRAGETVPVQKGVVQNRSFVGELATQIALLAGCETAEGVFHLGAGDASEELSFLRRLATAFGYDPAQVSEEGEQTCNAEMVMEKLPRLFPKYRVPLETNTIAQVAAQPELSAFRKNG